MSRQQFHAPLKRLRYNPAWSEKTYEAPLIWQVCKEENIVLTSRSRRKSQRPLPQGPLRRIIVIGLQILDTLVYCLVGVAFFAAAALALGYSVVNVLHNAFNVLPAPGNFGTDVLSFVSDLLLVLIIMEVLGTVRSYLEKGDTSVKPFLFIGIISATRGILSIGARLSISEIKGNDFNNAMIELGVDAFIIIALGVTLRIMGNYAVNREDEPVDLADNSTDQPLTTPQANLALNVASATAGKHQE
jgi:uncharacterized membrane protein (DUF373 family)